MPNYYGRPAFEYNPGTGLVVLQVPVIDYMMSINREVIKIVNESVDGSRVETDVLGTRYQISLQGSFMSEADKANFILFEEFAANGNYFTCYPHYPNNNRPAFYKATYNNCVASKDYKPDLTRSDKTAGMFNFAIAFAALSWED